MKFTIDLKKVQAALIEKRLTQVELAKLAKLHTVTINRILLGKGGVGIKAVRAVEKVLGVDVIKTNRRTA